MADHPGSHNKSTTSSSSSRNKPTGGPIKQRSSAGKNSATRTKTGTKRVRNYDPKNTFGTGGGKMPSVAKRYSPAGSPPDTPSGPSNPRS